nr:transglutaminase domain-containing protein [Candidatus Sigynarchaeota archaeon]
MRKKALSFFGLATIFVVGFVMQPLFTRASAISTRDYYGPPPGASITYGINTTYLYNYTYTITRTSSSQFDREMWISTLGNRTLLSDGGSTLYQQEFRILDEDWGTQGSPTRIVDDFGNSIYYFDLSIPGHSTWTLNVLANLTLRTVSWQGITNVSMSAYNVSDSFYALYTREEALINKSHPLIAGNATLLNDTSPFTIARNIYDFVTELLDYSLQEDEHGAEWAIEHGEGDCTEFSYLFVALMRACGIPARVLRGLVIADSSLQGVRPEFDAPVNRSWSFDWVYDGTEPSSTLPGHAWAEYFIPGYGWITADPTWWDADNYTSHVDNVHVPYITGVWTGEGVSPPFPGTNPTSDFSNIPYPIYVGDPGLIHDVSFGFTVLSQQKPMTLVDIILKYIQDNPAVMIGILVAVLLVVIISLIARGFSRPATGSTSKKTKMSFSDY